MIVGIVILVKGADFLIDGASKGALKLGVPEFLIGLTVVAFGTSAPELFVSVQATIADQSGLALGNVVGSNICNMMLILGVAVVMCKEKQPLTFSKIALKRDFPAVLLTTGFLCYFIFNDGFVIGREGQILLIFLLMYVFFIFQSLKEGDDVGIDEVPDKAEAKKSNWFMIILMVVGGLVGLVAGSELMIHGAVKIATALHISETIIGLSVIAIGTSLPELAATFAAMKQNKTDLVIGNVLGSNLFNILSVAGIASQFGVLKAEGLHPMNDVGFMMAFTVMVFLKVIFKPNQLPKSFGFLLLIGYAGYVFIRFINPNTAG